jgi:hypothetical protein
MLGVAGVDGATYYGYLDNATFWIPGIVAVGALLVACLLLAGWTAGRARVTRSSRASESERLPAQSRPSR